MKWIEQFVDWLNEYLKSIEEERKDEDPRFVAGLWNATYRIRSRLITVYNNADKTIISKEDLEQAAGAMCDDYCKYPLVYPEYQNDRMIDERCNNCPLSQLMERGKE